MDASALLHSYHSPDVTDAVSLGVQSESRLAAVQRSGLLDSPEEESFDALTRLAARLINVPVAFVTIVDAQRDFYKSQFGFPTPVAQDRQLAGRTFCQYTLASHALLAIDDTHANELWKAMPSVQDLGVRSYVGVPLTLDGENIGSFCVVDMQPREWQPDELETLRQLALSAEREISLRLALSDARSEAANSQALARSREETMAVVAHDLRTPLQILQLSTSLLERDVKPQQQAVTRRMFTAIDAMKTMVDGLLSTSALMAASVAGRQPIDAAQLARDAVNMMRPIAERAGIALALGDTPEASLSIDYAQMLRVLGNLIGNAIKYSAAGSAVTVSGTRSNSMVLLSVDDTGKGMTQDEQAKVFEKGWQGTEGMVRGDGAGLGLFIVKTLVEQHGGSVQVSGEIGTGSKFVIMLPCR